MNNAVESLNQSWLYRLVKIIYIFFFIFVLLLSLAIAHSFLDNKVLSPTSFERIGQEIKKLDPAVFNGFSDYEVGKRAYDRGSSKLSEYNHLISYDYKYSKTEKNVYYFLVVLAVFIIFEVIKRSFYYVALGSMKPQNK